MIIEKESPLYPECLKQFDAKIFVGGCISRGEGSRFRGKTGRDEKIKVETASNRRLSVMPMLMRLTNRKETKQ